MLVYNAIENNPLQCFFIYLSKKKTHTTNNNIKKMAKL